MPWTPEIWALWYTHVHDADPKFYEHRVTAANYFTARPYVDEYNRGSNFAGFVYTLEGKQVGRVQWSERAK